MFPLIGPVEVGLNCAVRMRFCAGESVTGVLPPVTEYPALALTAEIVTFALPVFVMVTFCEAEEVPVVTFPKLRLAGLMPKVRVAAIAVPLRPTEVGEVGALLTIERLPDTGTIDVGKNVTVIVVCFPAFTLKGSENPLTLSVADPDAVTWVMVNVAVPVLVMISA